MTCAPPAVPPAMISELSVIRPVSGSVNFDRTYMSAIPRRVQGVRTKLLTTSLIDFSGATPILSYQSNARDRGRTYI
jgi:hypothetical protein